MQLVDTAQRFGATLTVRCEDRSADGRSPMELLMLVATQGAKVNLSAEGEDAPALLDELARLIEAGFGEEL